MKTRSALGKCGKTIICKLLFGLFSGLKVDVMGMDIVFSQHMLIPQKKQVRQISERPWMGKG